jgi:hypothetical protein
MDETLGVLTLEGAQHSTEQRDLVRVHTVEHRFEADLLVQALQQEGIPVLLRRFEETAYDGLFVAQMGWGTIFVPADFEEAARTLIEGILDRVEKDDIPPATDRQEGADR